MSKYCDLEINIDGTWQPISPSSNKELKSLAAKVRKLPELLRKFKTPEAVTEACVDRIATVERMLK